MRGFVECRIKPYYLHHADLAPGTSHFRTTIVEGQALVRALRGRVSGLAQPTYVLDIRAATARCRSGRHISICAARRARSSKISLEPSTHIEELILRYTRTTNSALILRSERSERLEG